MEDGQRIIGLRDLGAGDLIFGDGVPLGGVTEGQRGMTCDPPDQGMNRVIDGDEYLGLHEARRS
jgi:hypothetical protein